MVIASNLIAEGIEDILREVLSEGESELLVVNPTADVLESLVSVATTST